VHDSLDLHDPLSVLQFRSVWQLFQFLVMVKIMTKLWLWRENGLMDEELWWDVCLPSANQTYLKSFHRLSQRSTISTCLMLMVLGMLNSWEDFVLYPGVFFCQRSQGNLTLLSRLKSLRRHLRTPLLMGKFYTHSSYSVIMLEFDPHELHLQVKKTIDSRENFLGFSLDVRQNCLLFFHPLAMQIHTLI